MTVHQLGREFVQIWEGRLPETGEVRWLLDWHMASGGVVTMSDRATEAEIEADAKEFGLPIVRKQPDY